MDAATTPNGISAGRLPPEDYARNFADLHSPLDAHEARVAADRCYFCHDAPCVQACPTRIDIPLFIREISTGARDAAARTILGQNILGGMCARVCPTETLCEEACVREAAEGEPVQIGRLQRYATDAMQAAGVHPFTRAEATGKRIAVVGAGPAGLSCAHRLAMHGHDVVILDAREKSGGLNEYGIASYKSVGGFAQAEVQWLLMIGGIVIRHETVLGRDVTLDALRDDFDAVFLGVGLGRTNGLGLRGDSLPGVRDAVDFIAELRQSDPADVAVGQHVVVIGGGMTAIDAAIQSKLLGARHVTLAYRGPKSRMKASEFEQDLAASKGVHILHEARPLAIHGENELQAVEFELSDGDRVRLPADQLLLAIGQKIDPADLPAIEGGKIAVSGAGRTSVGGVWAGGDCASGGDDLTVTAVAQGRDAAEDINATLMG